MSPSRSRRRRAPVVLTGTALGLAGVLAFRSAPATVSLGSLSSGAAATTSSAVASPTTTAPAAPSASTTTARATAPQRTSTTVATTTPPTTAAASTRSATGSSVNYFFGTLSVKVTAAGSKVTAISIASLNDGGNPRSQYIDQTALPVLIREALAAQSANIQGVSGASYTSQGFDASLAAALKDLGLA